ncbi:GNAT family N-acetyltransferase [Streptacidiphilus sp. P02-A3a]|uniref:GNAT family N-acetyltransferase n=1 Tax=Streptacidiphilus sp. P02-A3a TaxID=2704468 RepID=UPI0015FDEBAE|nr:GNAT family N-acetyltransferase [Streptacidiphilus sp. P02-A3a]QMU71110.1 GNAT family N-acetyltransferase [Streptacidiphilus sp. P02-A3a]
MRDHLLTGSGLLLRPWLEADAGAVLDAFGPPEMARQSGRAIRERADALLWVRERQADRAAGTGYAWAVVDDADGTLLGCAAVTSVDRRHDTGWVSYWTVAAARGRGVATASARTVADWAFQDLGLFRLELGHRTNNPASCRVATGAGFAVEGLERSKLRYGANRYDVELHARLADDAPGDPG